MYKIGFANIILVMYADVIKRIFLKIGSRLIRFSIKRVQISICGKNKDKIKA
jgi:hypothetical protein